MTDHKIGTRGEWLAARLELLKAEKALIRRSDEHTKDKNESKKDTEKLGEHYGIIKETSEPATVKNATPIANNEASNVDKAAKLGEVDRFIKGEDYCSSV
jgi:hypothetical protein